MKLLQPSPKEEQELRSIVEVFKSQFQGKAKSVKTDKLLFHLRALAVTNVSPQTFRKYVGHIRKHDLAKPGFIVSNVHTGYWYTENKAEMEAFLQQELDRMGNQFSNIDALRLRMQEKKVNSNIIQTSIF